MFYVRNQELNKKKIIAFGDGYNDLSLIGYCGYGVAMENAVDEVKEKSKLHYFI